MGKGREGKIRERGGKEMKHGREWKEQGRKGKGKEEADGKGKDRERGWMGKGKGREEGERMRREAPKTAENHDFINRTFKFGAHMPNLRPNLCQSWHAIAGPWCTLP